MLDIHKINERYSKHTCKRYGISLVAGTPFCQTLLSQIRALQLQIEKTFPLDVEWINCHQIHTTILRGKSRNYSFINLADTLFAQDLCVSFTEFNLIWGKAILETDGAIRVYAQSSSQIISGRDLDNINSHLSNLSNYSVTHQKKYWMTLGNLKARCFCNDDLLCGINNLTNNISLPMSTISTLKLVYYEDLSFVNTHIIKEYYHNG